MPRSTRSKESDTRMFFSNPRESITSGTVTALKPRFINNSLDMALKSMPFYGGEDDPNNPPADPANPPADPANPPADPPADPEKPILTNAEIKALTDQVKSLNGKVTSLTKENETFKKNETKASRAQLGKEEALQEELNDAKTTIAGYENALKEQTLINAINSNDKFKFHSIKHVMREIDPDMLEYNVDMEKGSATITGVEAELKRIARECDWLVKKDEAPPAPPQNPRQPLRPSGPPPYQGNRTADQKQTRREELMNRFPVIAHGMR